MSRLRIRVCRLIARKNDKSLQQYFHRSLRWRFEFCVQRYHGYRCSTGPACVAGQCHQRKRSQAKLYLITTRTICDALAILPDSSGAGAFPQMGYNGGTIGNIVVIPCDEVAAGEIYLIDATQCAAVSGPLKFDMSREAIVQMDDVGDFPGAHRLTSFRCGNSTGLESRSSVISL